MTHVLLETFLEVYLFWTILIFSTITIYFLIYLVDRLCGLVVRVPGYISRSPGSIPGAIRFSK
jgi:hypothetical protein